MNVIKQLNQKKATPETVLEVMRTSVFEVSGDLSAEQMRAFLRSVVMKDISIDEVLKNLEREPEVVREVALFWIATASNTDETRNAVEGALRDADRQMPLLETATVALVALYAIYKIGDTKPIKKTRRIIHRADGSWEESTEVEYDSFSAPLRGLLGIFVRKNDNDPSA